MNFKKKVVRLATINYGKQNAGTQQNLLLLTRTSNGKIKKACN